MHAAVKHSTEFIVAVTRVLFPASAKPNPLCVFAAATGYRVTPGNFQIPNPNPQTMTTRIKLFILHALLAIGLAAANAPAQTSSGGNCVSINCPTNIVAECAGTNGTAVDFTVTASTTCGRL